MPRIAVRACMISDTKLSNYSGLSVHYLNIFYGEARFFCYFCINNRTGPFDAPGLTRLTDCLHYVTD